jgi:hypothetical protein
MSALVQCTFTRHTRYGTSLAVAFICCRSCLCCPLRLCCADVSRHTVWRRGGTPVCACSIGSTPSRFVFSQKPDTGVAAETWASLLCLRCVDTASVSCCCAGAAQISHGNTARHALEYGDEVLAKICGSIASDEGRHEQAYQRVSDSSNSNEAMLCKPYAAAMMRC